MALSVFLFLLFFFPSASLAADDYQPSDSDYALTLSKVKEVTNLELDSRGKPLEQLVELKLLEGPKKGEIVIAHNLIPPSLAYSIIAETGKKYIVAVDKASDEVFITDYFRQGSLFLVMALFTALLILIGGYKGVKAMLSLVLIMAAILFGLLPAIKLGVNPILAAVFIAAIATASTMLLVAGWNNKSLAATLGTTGGVTVAGVLAYFFIKMAPLTGLASTEARILLGNLGDAGLSFNFQGVLAAGILIASLGAAMDVAISIASSTFEIHLSNPRQSRAELFAHSMNVGKDIMGTMTNTLVLAYTGSAIPLFLLLGNEPMNKVLNMEIIVTELTSAIVGSIGLLLAIPITAFLSVMLYKGVKKARA